MVSSNVSWQLILLVPLVVAGCATKGYVRDQVSAMERSLKNDQNAVTQQVERTNGKVSSLETAMRTMQGDISTAQAMALGDVDLEEIERHRVYFAFDSDELGADQTRVLDQAAATLASSARYVVNVYGFTDPTGSARYNTDLGRRRAEAAVRYLVDKTTDPLSRYQILSFGETAPEHETTTLGKGAERRQALVVILEPKEAIGRTATAAR